MQIGKTDRGFAIAEFSDRYGAACSIQESSIATEACLWLGVHTNRMHLTPELVREMLPLLEFFSENGCLPNSTLMLSQLSIDSNDDVNAVDGTR